MLRKKILVVLLSLVFNQLYSQNYKIIEGGTIINTDKNLQQKGFSIVLKDNKIEKIVVNKKLKAPANSQFIDATGKYIIPGLIDGHIHFFQSGGLYTRPDFIDLRHRRPYSEEVKFIKNNIDKQLCRYVKNGITTVVDMGGTDWNLEVKNKSISNEISPRVFTAAPLITPYLPTEFDIKDSPFKKVTTTKEAIAEVKRQINLGVDLIKIWYITWSRYTAEDFFPIAKAIVEESHKNNIPVFVHATELETAKKAIEAGCDVLVHLIKDKEVDEDFLSLAKENNITIIPTFVVFNSYNAVFSKKLQLSQFEHLNANPYVISTLFDMYELKNSELEDYHLNIQKNTEKIEVNSLYINSLKKINEAGINICAGTDAGNIGVLHTVALFREFEIMKKAEMSNFEILQSATFNTAKMIKKENVLGSIKKGKLADILILNSNPLDDIANTKDVNLIIKNGKIYQPEKILKYTNEDIVQIQLNAYNSRDIESFLSVYSNDVEIYEFPNKLLYKGKEKLRKVYSDFFSMTPNLHCKILNRSIEKNNIIDTELVSGMPNNKKVTAKSIYEIENNKIEKVWLVR